MDEILKENILRIHEKIDKLEQKIDEKLKDFEDRIFQIEKDVEASSQGD